MYTAWIQRKLSGNLFYWPHTASHSRGIKRTSLYFPVLPCTSSYFSVLLFPKQKNNVLLLEYAKTNFLPRKKNKSVLRLGIQNNRTLLFCFMGKNQGKKCTSLSYFFVLLCTSEVQKPACSPLITLINSKLCSSMPQTYKFTLNLRLAFLSFFVWELNKSSDPIEYWKKIEIKLAWKDENRTEIGRQNKSLLFTSVFVYYFLVYILLQGW